MACLLSHTVDEIDALVQKPIHEDSVRQKAMMDLAVQFDNASAAKQDLRQAYEKCNDSPQETRNLIDIFLKRESETHKDGSSSEQNTHKPTSPISHGFLTEKEYQQLFQDEEVLRETLEEQARAEKEWEDRIKKEEAERPLSGKGPAINRVLRTLIPFRGRFLVRERLVTSVLLLPGRANAGLGLVLAHHVLITSICLIGPGVHYDNMVQAQRPGIVGLKFRHLSVPSSFFVVALYFRDVSLYWLGFDPSFLFIMSNITDVRSVLTQKALKFLCEAFHISDEVHPQLLSPNQIIHEMPTGKIEMDLLFFIRTVDPTKVRIGKRERDEDEPKLLKTTIGRVVPLLPGDSASGGHGIGAQLVDVIVKTDVEDVAPAELQRKKKRKTKVVDAGEPSHPAKKLRGDYGVSGEPAVGGVNIAEAEVDYIVRTFVPIMTSATTATPTADPAAIAKERLVGSSVFGGDSSVGGSHPISGGFSDRAGSDFLVGGIHIVFYPDSNLQRVYVPMEHDQLFTEFNVGAARQISLSAEVRMRAEYNIKEKRKLKSMVEEKRKLKSVEVEAAEVVRLRDEAQALRDHNATLEKEKNELGVKVIDLAASVKVHKLEVSAAGLQEQVTVYENCMSQLEKFQDDEMEDVNKKFDKNSISTSLTTISRHRWQVTHDMELALAKCMNSIEYI
uniref:Uncharacterized protein n=1 Tax=Tanacetum cinerariifolium TaxID=118510 RepID=A0A6L2MKK5_TANCI|nr:hypothetical protein [Tanacetum cinerariifolium]